tara:strand:- start:244 stop:915 length:672 start_codon:yes stop_codon:yes gene_type:complete
MKIGILSTIDNPMLGLFIESILNRYKIDSIILDPKSWSEKDIFRWNQRTNGKITKVDIFDLNLMVPFFFIKNHNSLENIELINKRGIDLLINCGTPRILKATVLKAPKIGVLNCHPGILPDYRGCTCVEWALYNGDPVGNTAHLMTEKIDEGPIIYTKTLDFNSDDSYSDIRIANYLESINVMIEAIKVLKSKKIDTFEYPKNGNYYKPIDDEKMATILAKFS